MKGIDYAQWPPQANANAVPQANAVQAHAAGLSLEAVVLLDGPESRNIQDRVDELNPSSPRMSLAPPNSVLHLFK